MDEAQFLNRLEEVMELDPGSLKRDTPLADIPAWDSMAILGFIAMTDETFGVSPSPKAIAGCATVADLLAIASPK